jgi:dTDP-4-amino-4,6-dideoxygalactose transaminase
MPAVLDDAPKTGHDAPRLIPTVKVDVEPDAALADRLLGALSSGRLSNDGPAVRALEANAAAYLDGAATVAVANGSQALELALMATGRGEGAVVLPAYTFIATLNAVLRAGHEPVFCDIDPTTFTMDPEALAVILAERPDVRAVLPVTVFGVPPDTADIARQTAQRGATLILDNAHGFGSEVAGRRLPPGPRVQTFSLHATKSVPAGEGGLVVTDDRALAEALRRLRNHGLAPDLLRSTPGMNAKMPELTAAVADHSLARLPERLARRRAYAERLRACVARVGRGFSAQRVPDGVSSNFESLGVRCPVGAGGLDAVVARFRARGVEARRYFWPALHALPPWAGRFSLPITEAIAASVVCLPIHARMEEQTLARVEASIQSVAEESPAL